MSPRQSTSSRTTHLERQGHEVSLSITRARALHRGSGRALLEDQYRDLYAVVLTIQKDSGPRTGGVGAARRAVSQDELDEMAIISFPLGVGIEAGSGGERSSPIFFLSRQVNNMVSMKRRWGR